MSAKSGTWCLARRLPGFPVCLSWGSRNLNTWCHYCLRVRVVRNCSWEANPETLVLDMSAFFVICFHERQTSLDSLPVTTSSEAEPCWTQELKGDFHVAIRVFGFGLSSVAWPGILTRSTSEMEQWLSKLAHIWIPGILGSRLNPLHSCSTVSDSACHCLNPVLRLLPWDLGLNKNCLLPPVCIRLCCN